MSEPNLWSLVLVARRLWETGRLQHAAEPSLRSVNTDMVAVKLIPLLAGYTRDREPAFEPDGVLHREALDCLVRAYHNLWEVLTAFGR